MSEIFFIVLLTPYLPSILHINEFHPDKRLLIKLKDSAD